MQINQSELFLQQFEDILHYIAKDKLSAALNFKKEVLKNFNTLKEFPYKSPASKYSDILAIRDLNVKGYTIIYRVNEDKISIDVLEIFNKNLPFKNYYQ
jgi:plasmid stabilization system protein ParE